MTISMNWLRRCSQYFAKLYEQRCLSKYYVSIREFPVRRWAQLEHEGLNAITKKGKPGKYAPKAYEMLKDEIIDTFGVNDTYQKILRLRIKIALLRAEIATTGDRTRLLFIERAEQRIQELQENEPKSDIYEAIFHIQRYLSYKIDLNTYTVWEFFNDSKHISNLIKKYPNGAK
jgi:hypothetical protein